MADRCIADASAMRRHPPTPSTRTSFGRTPEVRALHDPVQPGGPRSGHSEITAGGFCQCSASGALARHKDRKLA
eukprot:1711493-Pyramimonas_sp.AAC.1